MDSKFSGLPSLGAAVALFPPPFGYCRTCGEPVRSFTTSAWREEAGIATSTVNEPCGHSRVVD